MPYSKPTGVVNLNLSGSYSKPVGVANLNLQDPELNRLGVIAGIVGNTLGSISIKNGRILSISGITPNVTGHVTLLKVTQLSINGITASTTGRIITTTDFNLLSDVVATNDNSWNDDGVLEGYSNLSTWKDSAELLNDSYAATYTEALKVPSSINTPWIQSLPIENSVLPTWTDADYLNNSVYPIWYQAKRITNGLVTDYADADGLSTAIISKLKIRMPTVFDGVQESFKQGEMITTDILLSAADGILLYNDNKSKWNQADYPGNADNPGPPIPSVAPYSKPVGKVNLDLRCPLPGTRLNLGITPCYIVPIREVVRRRTYMSLNSASVVRLPDLTPIEVSSITVETDFDSWCWALTATLKGKDTWELVKPINSLPREVLVTINGLEWKFMLDVPSQNRAFNSESNSLKGRSRSAWMNDPYVKNVDRHETQAREMVQLAEKAIENTGWTLDWQLENWVVPGGRYNSLNTPIGALIRLVNVTDDGLYTDPALQVMTAYKRWPVASWLIDGATADVGIPDAALISLSRAPVYTTPLNGVYVSGINFGVLAFVKIAGTDGALQPDAPFVDELICDEAGVAARQRGLNILSKAGAGFTLECETLLNNEVGLVIPGKIIEVAGIKGVTRSVRISAQWQNGLQVRQSIGLERREIGE